MMASSTRSSQLTKQNTGWQVYHTTCGLHDQASNGLPLTTLCIPCAVIKEDVSKLSELLVGIVAVHHDNLKTQVPFLSIHQAVSAQETEGLLTALAYC